MGSSFSGWVFKKVMRCLWGYRHYLLEEFGVVDWVGDEVGGGSGYSRHSVPFGVGWV